MVAHGEADAGATTATRTDAAVAALALSPARRYAAGNKLTVGWSDERSTWLHVASREELTPNGSPAQQTAGRHMVPAFQEKN